MHHLPRVFVSVLALALAAGAVAPLSAQGVLGKLKQKAKDRVEQVTDKQIDKALDKVECAVTDEACIAQAKKEGKQVELVDEDGNPTAAVEVRSGGQMPAKAQRPGEGAWENYDFVPGERVIFADDFSADRVGNFPKRLEFISGTLQVVEAQGKRWLRAETEATFALPLPEALPERWTLEFDITIPWWGMYFYSAPAGFEPPEGRSPPGHEMSYVSIGGTDAGIHIGRGGRTATMDPRRVFETDDNPITGQLLRARLHVDGKYAKFYLNEKRISNVPVTNFVRGNRIIFGTTGFPPGEEGESHLPTLYGNFSVNAGGREMYDALMADGRFVTQGILFDTGSDVLRPESTPTLNEIGTMLKEHPELRLRIEGHTDNVGDDAANLALSDKRAAAVKAYLSSKHGIDAARLETKGLGETKPVSGNETAEGRQNNRRVELVKL